MLDRRERPAPRSYAPGKHVLPRGRVAPPALVLALLSLLLASCATGSSGSTADVPLTSAASSTATAVATATAMATPSSGIPTLGTTPPSGLVLPSYFVTLIDSTNGSVGVLTTPGSQCSLSVSSPSGVVSDYPPRTVDTSGTGAFTYPPSAGRGQWIQTVRCTLGDSIGVAKAQVLLP